MPRPAPLSLALLFTLSLAAAILAGRSNPAPRPIAPPAHTPPPVLALTPLTPEERTRFDSGKGLYATCSGCHGPEGVGIAGQYPPLAGSARVQGPLRRVAPILFQGLQPIKQPGQPPAAVMPAPPFDDDDSIAGILTYIRRAWGNKADPVSPKDIAELRAQFDSRDKPWTTDDLDAIP